MNISKSKYISYKQCKKKIWLEVHHRELADEMDQTAFLIGNKVGEIARELYNGGTLVEYNSKDKNNISNMIEKTKELILNNTGVIYEATFSKDNLFAICDIMVKNGDGYNIYEVKGSTSLKEVYMLDAAFQYLVLTSLGIKVNNIYITHINNKYIRHGQLELNKLFVSEDITEFAMKMGNIIKEEKLDILSILANKEQPNVDIGTHCYNPYLCQFKGYCFKHVKEYSIFDIRNLRLKKKLDYYYNSIITFNDIVDNNIKLSDKQQLQINARLYNTININKEGIKDFLDKLYYPLYFLDFETFSTPIPPFDNVKPYEQIPSQYSLHFINRKDGLLEHKEFLAKEGEDPRYTLAKRLVTDIPENACIVVYNMAFEKRVIKNLALLYSDLEEQLLIMYNNIQDLMIPFRNKDYYQKEMKGSFSIKYVLPALFPNNKELSYENLEGIKNGQEASNAYESLINLSDDEKQIARKSLLEYCKLDTLAMVKIWERLEQI